MAKRMPIEMFVNGLKAAYKRKDGYIMGAKGQDPKKWSTTSWWFTQYKGSDRPKALYWRDHAARVWDCNGLAEGLYEDFSGVSINTRARYNYSGWCSKRGHGRIPSKYRVPGAAVFWGSSSGSIHHVAYLVEPVDPTKPSGDWYLIEARGVRYGVVRTRLYDRNPTHWGIMDKYFEYKLSYVPERPDRILRNGDEGDDVRILQSNLIQLGYSCGRWGADGDFGDSTEMALMAFQKNYGLVIDGEYGDNTKREMAKALVKHNKPVESPQKTIIEGGRCWVRTSPSTSGRKIGVAKEDTVHPYLGEMSENGWLLIEFEGQPGWVSGKYGNLTDPMPASETVESIEG